MRFVLHLLVMIAIALGTGFGLSYHALTDGRFFGALQSGPWIAWPDSGSPTPNPYTRAQITRAGSLQLGLSEGVQFVATSDVNGEPLSRACTYRIEGKTPVATFWTLAAVDNGGANIAAEGVPLSLRSNDIARAEDGSMRIHVGRFLSPGNWLEIAGTGPFELRLTLYDTVIASGFGVNTQMPAIMREACA